MALEFIDGFDHLNSTTTMRRKWKEDSNGGSGAGRFGGNCWRLLGDVAVSKTGVVTAIATRVVGFAFKLDNLNQIIFHLRDGTSTQLDLRVTSSGNLQITRNGAVLGTTSGAKFLAVDTWYYMEIKATIHASAGSFIVKVWGAPESGVWLTATGVNTQNTANATMDGWAITGFWWCDDFYVLNTSGTSNNDFLGECRIHTSLPSGDSATNVAWTPSTGTSHFALVDEVPPNDDTDYVSSATTGQIDTYTYPAISPTGPIAAVQVNMIARKDDIGARTLCAAYRGGGANYDAAQSSSMNDVYAWSAGMFEKDPATNAVWTASGVNSGEFGVKALV